jgi:hypothetical protein
MDPIYQTLLTMGCMLGSFYWGLKQGAIKGSQHTWEIVIEAFNAIYVDWNDDDNVITFTNADDMSKKFKSSEAWKSGKDL